MNSAHARERIEAGRHLNAFISLSSEEGEGPVVAVKDLVDVRGMVTTGGGAILPNTPADEDAPLVTRIRSAGGMVIGKTNLHEWAMGVTGDNPHYGPALNPHDPSRLAGGSSGGSAIAVASGMCDWAVGTDTGGSIRIPASLCGVVGYKPTVGTVDTTGVVPASHSLDSVGALAPSVAAAARGVEMMTGRTDLVSTVVRERPSLRLAVPDGWVDGLDDQTATAWERYAAALPRIPFPSRAEMGLANMKISLAEAGAFHRAWIAASPELYGADVLERLRMGVAIPAWEYIDALADRIRMIAAVAEAMRGWDAVVLPATATVAPERAAVQVDAVRDALTRFTRPFATTGQPVVTIPLPVAGLPVGIQIVGRLGDDADLLSVAHAVEVGLS
jgi:aspartyl-tRNA(Asn)/glutamyl-tRNA(Gln) amidotransferase subunit A